MKFLSIDRLPKFKVSLCATAKYRLMAEAVEELRRPKEFETKIQKTAPH
jgi:hypothetical protein